MQQETLKETKQKGYNTLWYHHIKFYIWENLIWQINPQQGFSTSALHSGTTALFCGSATCIPNFYPRDLSSNSINPSVLKVKIKNISKTLPNVPWTEMLPGDGETEDWEDYRVRKNCWGSWTHLLPWLSEGFTILTLVLRISIMYSILCQEYNFLSFHLRSLNFKPDPITYL